MSDNIDTAEVTKFDTLASRWWDLDAEFKTLHDINPIRLEFIDKYCHVAGTEVADIGCGGGILTESLNKRGANILGIDMAPTSLKIARLHALEQELTHINYEHITVEALAEKSPGKYDTVCCMEMLEHVPDPQSILHAVSQLLKPGGQAFFSTINRTPKAFALGIIGAEYVMKLLPKGTHTYEKFMRPAELSRGAQVAGLKPIGIAGIHYNPFLRHAKLTDDVSVNYLFACTKVA